MLIGNISFNEKFFEGMKYADFEKYIKSTDLEKGSGLTVSKLAKRLKVGLKEASE